MKKKLSVNKWSFDYMPESYDSHLKRSIPLYQESQFFISKISSYFIKDENINYEIGCANGTIIGNIAKEYKSFKKTKFIGIDLSKKLIVDPYINQFDLIFIDGAHTYSYLKNDSEKAFQMIKKGGYILWHDFNIGKKSCKDVVKYLEESINTKTIYHIKNTSLCFYQKN